MKADIGIYHGDEAWALKGLGIDFEKAFQELGFTTVRTDQVFNGIRPLSARNHFFVQQGQLLAFCSNLNLIPKNTICLFTHYSSDFGEQLKVLNRSKGVIFFSQYQEALALSNGLKDDISTSIIMAADPKKHRVLKEDELNKKLIQSFELNSKREHVGFCLKYWEKNMIRVVLTALAVLFAVSACTTTSSDPNQRQVFHIWPGDVSEIQFRHLDTVNAFRQASGLTELQLSAELTAAAKTHALELSADVFNFANLLNKDWGNDNNYGNRDLMRINGFDSNTQGYTYRVQTGTGTEPINGTPWRLQLGMRYSFN